ncbi:hypothetical protein [Chitinibacter tainanensis]|uniref:hypothetical protein n=1 Tax=Chitinibacter tainanensis TaxID=230667 RepID=UPI002352412B|nr:hypothetical protein [Chitinibacter tainanensis]
MAILIHFPFHRGISRPVTKNAGFWLVRKIFKVYKYGYSYKHGLFLIVKYIRKTAKKLMAECDIQTDGRVTDFAEKAQNALERVADAKAAGDSCEMRAAAAAYGGLVKRWRRYVIQQLTEAAFLGLDTSRVKVREWQLGCFGQSLASAELARYAKPARSGGGRVDASLPQAVIARECARQFEALRDELRRIGN